MIAALPLNCEVIVIEYAIVMESGWVIELVKYLADFRMKSFQDAHFITVKSSGSNRSTNGP